MTNLVLRYLGFCAICERDIKIDERGCLVHHGYQRPGDGRIHGDCFAVGREPYERTCEPVKQYRKIVESSLARAQEFLGSLKAGKVRYFVTHDRHGEIVREYVLGVTDLYDFEQKVRYTIQETEYAIRSHEREVARLTKWIDAWTLKPVRTVEEDMIQKKAASDASKAARAAAKQAKLDKRAAIDTKKAALEAKRVAMKDGFVVEIKALAERKANGENVTKQVDKLWRKILAQRSWLDGGDLKCDVELIALDIAWRTQGFNSSWVNYRSY